MVSDDPRPSRTGVVTVVMAVSPSTPKHMDTTTQAGDADPEASGWLTTVLRPAGTLDWLARRRLSQAVSHLASSCDMVVIDLTATNVAAPRALARNLRAPALELARAGRCLLLVGAPPCLVAELDRSAIMVATLAADSALLPAPRQPKGERPRPPHEGG